MKFRILFVAIFTIIFSTLAFSQVKQINSREFYEANSTAFKLMAETSRRLNLKTETFDNGSVISSVSKIEERLAPDKSRYLQIEKKDGKETTIEFINIGSMEYKRENGGAWTKKELGGYGSGSGIASTSASISQYTEESDFVEGIPARKLKELRITQSPEGLMYDEFLIWFDQRGFFLKTERTKGNLEPRTVKTRSTATYQYDPSDIKIEAPIQ